VDAPTNELGDVALVARHVAVERQEVERRRIFSLRSAARKAVVCTYLPFCP